MNYLEVKIQKNTINHINVNTFVSSVIKDQKKSNYPNKELNFNDKKLLELGFVFNCTTNGYAIEKEFRLQEIEYLANEISKLKNHSLTHGYIEMIIHDKTLYFWDKALIYEGIDTFNYCLKYHNLFNINNINVITKSNGINETLLNLANCTLRYEQPNLKFITTNSLWDKKEGKTIHINDSINFTEYISKSIAKIF